ncbi:MAG TPA: flagellar export protein FliJ [Planctomycetaceae bacterium]|nr:flagellar export protein FliJ [Planctomycetaceae bacterium]
MSKFQFRLLAIIKLRERERDDAAEQYRKSLLAIEKLGQQIAELEAEIAQQMQAQTEASQGHLSPDHILAAQRYQHRLSQQIQSLQQTIAQIEPERDRRRQILIKKEQDLKAIEKVQAKRLAEFTAAELAREQAGLDQWASLNHHTTGSRNSAANSING